MADDNHIPSHLQQSTSQGTQIQQQQMNLTQIQQQHMGHSQMQQNQMQQVHIQQLPIQQQSQIQQQQQIQQQSQMQQQHQIQQQSQMQQQVQQIPMEQSQMQQQVQQTQEAANANMSVNSDVQQANQINSSPSVQFNVATVNASQTQQIQTFSQNINSSSGAPVHQQIVPHLHSIQASASYPVMQSTVSMAQSPMQQSIVNSSTLNASGQVVGTAAKLNFPPPIMPAPTKTIIQNRPGFAASNQAIIGTAFINQSQPLHQGYSSVPANSSAQVYNTNQVKQINSQPQILHMPGTMLNQAQIFALPQGLTWAPMPGNFQSSTMFAQNPIIIPSQQPHVFFQSPQNTVQIPASAVQPAMPTTTFAIATSLPSRIRPRVRPGIQTVAVATQTMASNAVIVNPNVPSMRPQTKPKNKFLSPISNGYVQPVTHQMVAAQTQQTQSLPQFHPSPVLHSDSVSKSVILSKTKPIPIQSKSVEVDTKQLSQQIVTESKDVASYIEVQSAAAVGTSSTISVVNASSLVKETVVNPFISSSVMPSTSVVTSSVVTTATSVAPVITSSTSTVSVTPIVTSSVVQERITMDTTSAVDESISMDTTSDVQDIFLNGVSSTEENKNVNALPHIKENSSVNIVSDEKENVPMTLCSEASTTTASPSKTPVKNADLENSEIILSVSEPQGSKDTVSNNSPPTGIESTPEKPLSQPLSPVKEKHRQRAIVKPQVLTHVIDGFVIQEGPEPFPVRQSSLQSNLSDKIKPSKESKETKDDLSPSPAKKAKVGKPRGRPRKRRMSVKQTKEEQKQNSNQTSGSQEVEQNTSPTEEPVLQVKTTEENNRTEETSVTVLETEPVETSVVEKVEEAEVVKPESDLTQKLPTKWSVQEVFEFIRDLPGCSDYADVFRSQEIDGQALLLLKEDHLMTSMCMKLGPAVKLISHINSIKEKLSLHT